MIGGSNSRPRVWLAPVLIGLVSIVGLILALVADGLADLVSVALLAIPTWLCLWKGYLER
jgi:hypothetical protein